MKLFSGLYEHAMRWAAHRHAQWYLVSLSFAESSFFPVPPDVMLAPMALADNKKAWRYAAMTTAASVVGGMLGYLIVYLAFDAIEPWIIEAGYSGYYQQAVDWFAQWGVWTILIAGFSPIPYKVFTLSAGVFSISFPVFLVASIISRGLRFFLVAGLFFWFGPPISRFIDRYFNVLTWAFGALLILGFLVIEFVL